MTLLKTLLATALVAASLVSGRARPRPHHQVRLPEPEGTTPGSRARRSLPTWWRPRAAARSRSSCSPAARWAATCRPCRPLQGGTVEMTVLNAGILSAQTKEFGIYDFPFLFASPQEADAVTDGPFGKKLLDKLKAKNLGGPGLLGAGFRNVTNSKSPSPRLKTWRA